MAGALTRRGAARAATTAPATAPPDVERAVEEEEADEEEDDEANLGRDNLGVDDPPPAPPSGLDAARARLAAARVSAGGNAPPVASAALGPGGPPPAALLALVNTGQYALTLRDGAWAVISSGPASGSAAAAGVGGRGINPPPAAGVPSGSVEDTWHFDSAGNPTVQNLEAADTGDEGLGITGAERPLPFLGAGYRALGRRFVAQHAGVVPLTPSLAIADPSYAYLSTDQQVDYQFESTFSVELRNAHVGMARLSYEVAHATEESGISLDDLLVYLPAYTRLLGGLSQLANVRMTQLQVTGLRDPVNTRARAFGPEVAHQVRSSVYNPMGTVANTARFGAGGDVLAAHERAVQAGRIKALLQHARSGAAASNAWLLAGGGPPYPPVELELGAAGQPPAAPSAGDPSTSAPAPPPTLPGGAGAAPPPFRSWSGGRGGGARRRGAGLIAWGAHVPFTFA